MCPLWIRTLLTSLLLRFGIAVVNLDLVARVLAADVLRVHEVDVLDPYGTLHELRRRYASLAVETGLPMAAQRKVADMAWGYIAQAQGETVATANRREFTFYD